MTDPKLYSDRARRLDTLAGPDNVGYWNMLVRLSDQYTGATPLAGAKDSVFGMPIEWSTFGDWCEDVHGFRPQYDDNGGITGHPKITDEHKYTLCLLKYSG